MQVRMLFKDLVWLLLCRSVLYTVSTSLGLGLSVAKVLPFIDVQPFAFNYFKITAFCLQLLQDL